MPSKKAAAGASYKYRFEFKPIMVRTPEEPAFDGAHNCATVNDAVLEALWNKFHSCLKDVTSKSPVLNTAILEAAAEIATGKAKAGGVDGFIVNNSIPVDGIWKIVPSETAGARKRFIHPVNAEGSICIGCPDASAKPRFVQLAIEVTER